MGVERVLSLVLAFMAGRALAEPPSVAAPRVLTVAAAASLKPAVEEAKRAFEAAHPGVEVRLTLGASGALSTQVRLGAPFDLLLSADREYPRRLVEAGLAAPGGETVYAVGTLVAWLPPGSALPIEAEGLAALARPDVRRVAIANPAVAPYGRAAEAALRAAGVLEAVRGKLVLGTSVAQAAQFATTGAADVALLPRALALSPELAGGRAVPLPASLAPPVEHSAVVLAAAREARLAADFLAFLVGPAGRALLGRAGYGPPPP